MSQSKGEYRVGVSFNPSSDGTVDEIKSLAAKLIDLINTIPSNGKTTYGNEVGRLKALAVTDIEKGAMWAVKAATKPTT